MDVDESFVPQNIKDRIEQLNTMIKEAEVLSKEIIEWYHGALLDMDSEVDIEDELFDVTNTLCVEGIDFNAVMEGVSAVRIFRATYEDIDLK